jgi:Rps23 Pro-64 3,4-dihydroxylase Tpa1-like proline 4-hydroxylase
VAISGIPKFLVIDDFLSPSLLASLLEHALEQPASYVPTGVMRHGESQIATDARISSEREGGLGPHKVAFAEAVVARLDQFIAELKVPPFALTRTELQLIAHGDDAFYKAHIDTHTQSSRTDQASDRVLSCVFYFHREPKGFTGGEIAIHPFAKGEEPVLVDPRQNRLVVFPSFVWHEVRRISCPSGTFADSRFAINCWLHRARQAS